MRGLSDQELDLVRYAQFPCDGSCRNYGVASPGTIGTALKLLARGLILQVPCEGGGPWAHPRLTAAGRTALACVEAERLGVDGRVGA